MSTVLVVDDDELVLAAARRDLAGPRHVLTARNRAEAAAIWNVESIKTAVIDARLGTESGIALLAGLMSRHPHARAAVMSGHMDIELLLNAAHAGARLIASKPCRPRDLVTRLENAEALVIDVQLRTIAGLDAARLDDIERQRILGTLERCDQNKSRAAKQLGISRVTLNSKLARYRS